MSGLDGLAVASVIATLLLTPLAVRIGGDDLLDGRVLLLGAAVELLSSVIPYSCEMVALRSLRPAVFGILMSLEPAAAALAGYRRARGVPHPGPVGGHDLRRGGQRRRHADRPLAEPFGLNGSVHLDVTRR